MRNLNHTLNLTHAESHEGKTQLRAFCAQAEGRVGWESTMSFGRMEGHPSGYSVLGIGFAG